MSHSRTIIATPGQGTAPAGQATVKRFKQKITLQGRMLAGVLYSVSRDMLGEVFPIYVGKNTIGSNADCDVCLREATVADHHATLLVRKVNDGQGNVRTSLSISEDVPGAEIAVNDCPLDEQWMYCNAGDRLQIGCGYVLSIQLMSPESTGTFTSADFDSLPEVDDAKEASFGPAPMPSPADIAAMMYGREPTYRDSISEDDERSFYAPSKAKSVDHLGSKTVVENK